MEDETIISLIVCRIKELEYQIDELNKKIEYLEKKYDDN